MKKLSKINWVNTIFLLLTPLISIVGLWMLISHGELHWQTWVLALVMMIATGLSITGGYHRLFSHRSYQAAWPVRLFFLLFGAAAFEGSVLEWCTDHRDHHRYTDTDRDPYNINRGFWYAHIGWLFTLDASKRDMSNVADLEADPLNRWQHRYFILIGSFFGFVFPMLIAALWGDALGGLIIAGALRITLNQHFTFCINSVCHLWGKRNYSDRQSARDNWITALFTYGEGFHNFHHQFPIDYRNGIRYFHYDPTKWLIRGLSFTGLVSQLKRVSEHRIIKYQIKMDQKQIMQNTIQSAEELWEHVSSQVANLLKPVHEKLQQLIARYDELEKDYEKLKQSRREYMTGKMTEYRQRLQECRQRLKSTHRELRYFHSLWMKLLRHQQIQASNA